MTEPRRLRRTRRAAGFASEAEVRAACARVRASYQDDAEAEASPEWAALRPAVARWIRSTAARPPPAGADAWALGIARVYLASPHLLPALPPRA